MATHYGSTSVDTTSLRDLLELLKEFGVTSYTAQGISLELGGSISVHKHSTKDDSEPQERKLPVDPRVKAMFERLPAGYQAAFQLGEG